MIAVGELFEIASDESRRGENRLDVYQQRARFTPEEQPISESRSGEGESMTIRSEVSHRAFWCLKLAESPFTNQKGDSSNFHPVPLISSKSLLWPENCVNFDRAREKSGLRRKKKNGSGV